MWKELEGPFPMNMKVVEEWDAQLNQWLLRNCSSVGLIEERTDSPVFPHLWLEFILSEFYPLHFFFFFILIPWHRWEKQEKHMGLQIMQFGSQGFLATESQFWTFPPPSRPLYLQWWVWNSMTANRSWLSPWPIIPWENLGHHLLFLPTSSPICE